MAVVNQTDRPKLNHNRCVIEVYGAVFMLLIGCCILCWYTSFRYRTESDLVEFFFFVIVSLPGIGVHRGNGSLNHYLPLS